VEVKRRIVGCSLWLGKYRLTKLWIPNSAKKSMETKLSRRSFGTCLTDNCSSCRSWCCCNNSWLENIDIAGGCFVVGKKLGNSS
jgi:hypothetical protein